jgi:hypothetical protein
MHRCRAYCLAVVSLVMAAASGLAADSEPQPLPLNQVPKAVVNAVMAKYPNAKPQSAAQGIENNQPFIDVHVLVNNQKIWLTCNPNGKINVIDREITLKDLPAPVARALNNKYPQAKIRLVNEITAEGPPTYDIAVTFHTKPLIGVFAASGEFLNQLDDEE